MSRMTYITAAAILAALLIATPGQVNGQTADLQKSNPGELHVLFLFDNQCPNFKREYQKIIDGELVRARIKESTTWPRIGELYLTVDIDCLSIEDRDGRKTGWFYLVERSFKVFSTGPDILLTHNRILGYSMGGPSPRHDAAREIRRALREAVADILTDYLKANQSP